MKIIIGKILLAELTIRHIQPTETIIILVLITIATEVQRLLHRLITEATEAIIHHAVIIVAVVQVLAAEVAEAVEQEPQEEIINF